MTKRRIKIITLGSCEVGKSALIKRFCEHRFERRYYKTVGVDYGSINVNIAVNDDNVCSDDVVVDFFDLSGDPNDIEIRNEFYDDVHGCLLVYDISNSKSFKELEKWILEGRRFGLGCKVQLCANKTDLMDDEIQISNANDFAKKHGMKIFETSALNGSNVMLMFEQLFHDALRAATP